MSPINSDSLNSNSIQSCIFHKILHNSISITHVNSQTTIPKSLATAPEDRHLPINIIRIVIANMAKSLHTNASLFDTLSLYLKISPPSVQISSLDLALAQQYCTHWLTVVPILHRKGLTVAYTSTVRVFSSTESLFLVGYSPPGATSISHANVFAAPPCRVRANAVAAGFVPWLFRTVNTHHSLTDAV